jgi:hypothetical protein
MSEIASGRWRAFAASELLVAHISRSVPFVSDLAGVGPNAAVEL